MKDLFKLRKERSVIFVAKHRCDVLRKMSFAYKRKRILHFLGLDIPIKGKIPDLRILSLRSIISIPHFYE